MPNIPTWSAALIWGALALSITHCASSSNREERSAASGGGGGAQGSGETGGEEAGGAGAGLSLCADYCSTVMANCTEAHAVYTSETACLAVCEDLPAGSSDDEIGNSVHCRLRNAELAASTGEPGVHCPIAGPGGDGVCGSNCEGYCVLMQAECSARFSQAFNGLADCQSQCNESLPDPGSYDVSQSSGNSVNCRLWHVSAAALDPSQHCPHASGEPPCA